MALAPAFSSALQQFTINVWIYVQSGGAYRTEQNIVGQQSVTGGTPQTNCNFLIRGNGFDGFEGVIRLAGTEYVVNFGAVSVGGWRNLTLTYNGSQLISYVSGGVAFTTNVTGSPTLISNGLQTIIGGTTNAAINNGNVQNYFDGRINVVNIYNLALESGEVSQLNSVYSSQRQF